MRTLKQIGPSVLIMGLVIAFWWAVVAVTRSAIFPTPGQVLRGIFDLAADGTLWRHIGASLFRVGVGFTLAVAVAVPLGLWMGWMRGAFVALNPILQMLRPISPI